MNSPTTSECPVALLRRERGISQSNLAAWSGCCVTTVQAVERRRRGPSLDLLEAFSNVFGVPLGDLHLRLAQIVRAVEHYGDDSQRLSDGWNLISLEERHGGTPR